MLLHFPHAAEGHRQRAGGCRRETGTAACGKGFDRDLLPQRGLTASALGTGTCGVGRQNGGVFAICREILLRNGGVLSRSFHVGSAPLRFIARFSPHLSDFRPDFAHDHRFVHAQTPRQLVHIHLSHDVAGDDGDASHDVANHFGALHGIARRALHEQVGFETHEVRLMRLDVSFEFFGGVRLCETIGVLAFGKQEDFDVESLGKKHVDAAQ